MVRKGYSSGEDGWDSEEVDILLVSYLNISIGGLQEKVKRGFWEVVGCHIVFIAFKKLPGLSGLIQTILDPPRLLHTHILESQKG